MDEKILLAAFIPFGEVKEVSIPIDAGTGLKRGFGFVEFEEADELSDTVRGSGGFGSTGKA